MKTGIIGLPQVGKTSLFGISDKSTFRAVRIRYPREAHIGVAKVPDERWISWPALSPEEADGHASVEYVDVGAIGQDALKETAYIGHLRQVDALIHVLRAFENDAIPHVVPSIRCATSRTSEFDLMVSDLGQIEKRLERLEKDLKKMKTAGTGKRKRAADQGQSVSRSRKAAARNGNDTRRQEAHPRLHVSERETDALRAQYRREAHNWGKDLEGRGCEI